MSQVTGFPPVVDRRARVLILGSMPGRVSLEENQYYAMPRNAFWRIMGDLFGAGFEIPYEDRLEALLKSGVALWDVLESCYRPGSLDSAIDPASARPNDFENLFDRYPAIGRVYFNGRKAADIYMSDVFPIVEKKFTGRTCQTLPSTSPAHAAMSYARKLDEWSVVASKTVI
jgi:TDG/mug DNA glycosylase family protein